MSLSCPSSSDVSLAARVPCEPSMQFEIYRFGTFKSFPDENKPFITRLAEAGFYYTDRGDEVACYICALRKHGWSAEADPIEVHIALSPGCLFLTQNSRVNVPVTSSLIERHQLQIQSQNLQIRNAQGSSGNQNNHISRQVANPVFDENIGAPTVCNNYASINERVASFQNSDRIALTPTTFAKAGFFYTGYGDHVRCFKCGIDLHNWLEGENALIEHFRWSKDCLFVKQVLVRGQLFSNSVNTIDTQCCERELYEQHSSRNYLGHRNNSNDSSMEDMEALSEDNQRIIDRHFCIRCRRVLRSVVFMNCPTPHLLACHSCVVHYDSCPLCNTVIKALLYLPSKVLCMCTMTNYDHQNIGLERSMAFVYFDLLERKQTIDS